MDSFEIVKDVRARSHRSWLNLKNAVFKELGRPYYFGTPAVERTSMSYLKKAEEESCLTAIEILAEIEKRNLA